MTASDASLHQERDTIAAIATASGMGGIGIVRLSGKDAVSIAEQICGQVLKPRHAHYADFFDAEGLTLDQGIAIYFAAPNSFTGEDVVELQGHGGSVILDLLLQRCCQLGARPARAGEFSERAFLNDRLDLTQAEAIADLIEAESIEAARAAGRSLQGEFSKRVTDIVEELIGIRIFAEAAIDFPEEEIDFIAESDIAERIAALIDKLSQLIETAWQGSRLREGAQIVIAGLPNAGKSSLLNRLAGREAAIVTDIAGTTRDTIREQINIDGMPLHITDTAGMNATPDAVEAIGMERAGQAIEGADIVLWVYDSSKPSTSDFQSLEQQFGFQIPKAARLLRIANKIDIGESPTSVNATEGVTETIAVSAKTGEGFDSLREKIKQSVSFSGGSSLFSARRRHLTAMEKALGILTTGYQQLKEHKASELLAEDLRQAQRELDEITGKFSSDDLLGRVFSSFCIGK